MRQIGPRHLQPDWFGVSGEQKFVEAELFAAAEHDMAPGDIDRRRGCAEPQLDAVIDVKLRWAQRNPLLRRGAREVILGQVGSIVRCCCIVADDGHATGIALTTQHFGSGIAGPAAANDNHSS